MAWTGTEGSHVFRPFLADVLGNTTAFDLDADTFKAALYGNTGTPTPNVTSALSAYAASTSQWVTANEVTSSSAWPTGGVALTMAEGTVGTLLASTFYVWYGKICATMSTSQGQGVVTAFIMMSDVKDEIDFEFIGNDVNNAQSNWYSQGVTNCKL